MSFRLFVYYCAACSACAAYVGWALGRCAAVGDAVNLAGIKGLFLGVLLALALGLVDGLGSASGRQFVRGVPRILFAVVVGGIGGLAGGMLGQALYDLWPLALFLILGWLLTGLLIGICTRTFCGRTTVTGWPMTARPAAHS